ncbi:DNA (cytosine-5)-methyltransferase 1 [Desulfatibacillum alkenivorans DSM 16219]|jgi:DNA (cytosine-5)-methyltransferase 1|uniref:DNA (cytosine-5-)-methyltransferase n=1 Tax=Desulfatibacillum alkenivorans DSM 16219 TaxID=1121393 RepID=A0A1M6EDT3_9BACT|nr:DNA cytosine methyltransferase [Desulfatibacillum alkenivorans]SHI83480.1 DNA (cytosine-5)-methyltransferase 1 [Desulfatibacillum alkenivorans DSM 16219]
MADKFRFYEFFAGGGMASLGLGPQWKCVYVNEWCKKKARSYEINHGGAPRVDVRDVAQATPADLKENADLAWASFPCQDLSLAGNGKGLQGARSGTFWPFWDLMKELDSLGRGVPVIVLENVVGALSSNKGEDFKVLAKALSSAGYCFGPLVMNAVHFTPQSRPRLFIVACKKAVLIPESLRREGPDGFWHTPKAAQAYNSLPASTKKDWIWWNLPRPEPRKVELADLIEDAPQSVSLYTPEETKRILSMMSEANINKVEAVKKSGKITVGTVYKRTRKDSDGNRVQRAEVRFDQISGCLRTPAGGSSRQILMIVNGKDVSARLISTREAARLMGLPDDYQLPQKYNEAYHLIGDGLAVPVVSWLADHLLYPLASVNNAAKEE